MFSWIKYITIFHKYIHIKFLKILFNFNHKSKFKIEIYY